MKRMLALGLLLALTFAVLVACGKDGSGELAAVGDYELPTELTEVLGKDSAETNITRTVDFAKNQLTVTTWYASAVDPAQRVLESTRCYLLDEYGNIVRKIHYDSNGRVSDSSDYAYDESGRRIREVQDVHLTGSMIYCYKTYSHSGNRITMRDCIGDMEPLKFTLEYDKNGRLTESTYRGSVVTFRYDEHGHLEAQEYDERSEFKNMHDDSGRLTEMAVETGVLHANLSLDEYKTFQMTEGQYRCALLLITLQSGLVTPVDEMYRCSSAGDPEKVCYADGTPLKACAYSDDGKLLAETFYLPGKEVEYTVKYTYGDGGKLSGTVCEDADGKELLALSFDADGNPVLRSSES